MSVLRSLKLAAGCYLHSLALKVQAIFAGHLIEVIILQEGLLHHPSGKQAEKFKLGTRREGTTASSSNFNAKLSS